MSTQTTEEADWLRAGTALFAQHCGFLLGVAKFTQLPETHLIEVAFAGRSNVGKSSLINALTGQNKLARTSNQPGRTQEINFFELAEGRPGHLFLVDLPGYGFARAPKERVVAWSELVTAYLRGRANLRRVFVLIDARRGVLEKDHAVMALLDEAAVSYQVVLTKIDHIPARERDRLLDRLRQTDLAGHPAAHPEILVTSARKRIGLDALRAHIAALALER